MNKKNLIDQFNDLAEYETNPFKKRAYTRAGEIIAAMNDEELVSRDNFKDIEGIGDAINKKILQFKDTGFIDKWKEIQQS